MFQFKTFTAALIGLAVTVGANTASAQCVPDSFEPNDACGAPSVLTPGNYTGLTINGWIAVGGLREDYYQITVGVGEEMNLDIAFDINVGHLELWLFDNGTCTGFGVDSDLDQSWNGVADVYYNNTTAAPVDLVCKVKLSSATTVCISYDMNMSQAAHPCNTAVEDSYAPNQGCSSSAVLTTGTHTGLMLFGPNYAGGIAEDFFVVQDVPAGDILTVDLTYTHSEGDIALALTDAACASSIKYSNYQTGTESIEFKNDDFQPKDFYIEVQAFGQSYVCGGYEITVTTQPDPCNAVPDDIYSPNHSCSGSVPLPAGTHTGLMAFYLVPDYFDITVPAGKRVQIDALFSHATANINIALYDGGCGTQLDSSTSFTDDEFVFATNPGPNAVTYQLEVEIPYDIPNCNGYELVVSIVDDPCLTATDDHFAPNHTCSLGVPISPGQHQNLFVSKFFRDYFEVTVAPGATLDVTVDCVSSAGNVVAYLYDPLIGLCDQQSDVARATSNSDSKSFSFTNNEAIARSYELEIMLRDWDSEDCNNYSLLVMGSVGQAATPFCLGDGSKSFCPCSNQSALGAGEGCLSSMGFGAILTAVGTNVVASDDMKFQVTQGRPNQPSMLVQGSSEMHVPFKDGILCMGNPTERMEVVFLDANGEGLSTLSTVTEGNVLPGETRYYQQWYRDPGGISPCGSGSNFTQGLIVNWL